MSKQKKVVLNYNNKKKDFIFEYTDNNGKSLMAVFFNMIKTTGHRTDFKMNLEEILKYYGYDVNTFKITCKKLNDNV